LLAFFIKYLFACKYILNEKSKTNKTVSLKIVWLKTKARKISNRRNRMPLTLVSPGWVTSGSAQIHAWLRHVSVSNLFSHSQYIKFIRKGSLWFQVIFIWREAWQIQNSTLHSSGINNCWKYPHFSNFKTSWFLRIDHIYLEPSEHVFLVKNLILRILSIMFLHERLVFTFIYEYTATRYNLFICLMVRSLIILKSYFYILETFDKSILILSFEEHMFSKLQY